MRIRRQWHKAVLEAIDKVYWWRVDTKSLRDAAYLELMNHVLAMREGYEGVRRVTFLGNDYLLELPYDEDEPDLKVWI